MYVIRFSKINIAQVSSVTLENKIRLRSVKRREQNSDPKDRTDTTLLYQPQLAAPFQFALPFYGNALEVTAATIGI